ncbi:MAG TPA: SLBB domain-containing protein, partial [Ideonella sp.]|nr:SLBB domain-containing protein [Ideonella sp.]
MIDSLLRRSAHPTWHSATARGLAACLLSAAAMWPLGGWAQQTASETTTDSAVSGPVRLRQATPANGSDDASLYDSQGQSRTSQAGLPLLPSYRLGEFERFVNGLANIPLPPENDRRAGNAAPPPPTPTTTPTATTPARPASAVETPRIPANAIRRLGAELMTGLPEDAASTPQVPADYLVSAGDELQLTLWGAVDGDLRLVVDRSGRISIPRVGSVMVAGVRYADLGPVISQRVSQVFHGFQLNVVLGKLRGIRIYVTGFTARPGSYTVSSLSTIVNALMRAGGPSASGSFRNIELRRGGKLISNFDLYDLLLRGDKSADRVLQSEDVVHVGPVGPQTAVIGSVNRAGIFELKPGETVADVLRMAGGFSAVADHSRLAVERIDERNSVGVKQLALPADASGTPSNGEVMRAFSAVEAALSTQKQNKRVRIEGEVAMPGEYILPPGSTLATALQAAGGMNVGAYVFGTDLSRESVRIAQQANYERALRDLETDFARTSAGQRAITADEAAAQSLRAADATRLIERLRAVQPTGRVVLQVDPVATQLPDLILEDGDRVNIPPQPTSVGIFGSVFSSGSYLYQPSRQVNDYLNQAGGPTRGADEDAIFVIRANGSVISSRQRGGGWFTSANLNGVAALPGDTIFVPEELNKVTFLQGAKEWTQILYQFGLGAA